MRVLTNYRSDEHVRIVGQMTVVIGHTNSVLSRYSKMAETKNLAHDLQFLESPLLKILLMRGKTERVSKLFCLRPIKGEYHTLLQDLLEQPNKFFEYFRMLPGTFNYILEGIEESIKKQSNFGECISAKERLALTLRYLSTGMSFRSLSFSYRISHTAIRQIVYETCLAIWNTFREKHMPIPTTDILQNIAKNYFKKWNFPNCVGCIDGKHIRIKCPKNSGSVYYNYKQYFSIVLQGMANANYKFVVIDVGAYGKQSDGGIFSLSNVYKCLETKTFSMPNPEYIPSTEIKTPFVILGDEAYPLKPYLLKPYSRQNLSNEERIFNYRLSRARRCIECAFGILVAKWRFLKTELQVNPENVDILVQTACLLHNILIDIEGVSAQPEHNIHNDKISVSRRYNHHGAIASQIRDIFRDYFCSPEGAIQFQYNIFT